MTGGGDQHRVQLMEAQRRALTPGRADVRATPDPYIFQKDGFMNNHYPGACSDDSLTIVKATHQHSLAPGRKPKPTVDEFPALPPAQKKEHPPTRKPTFFKMHFIIARSSCGLHVY